MSLISAPVTNILRCSLHDGPGIRTVVYLKGCAMRCAWCHNPETLSPRPQLQFFGHLCIGCGECLTACPHACHRAEEGRHIIDFDRCIGCGRCAEACPAGASVLCGEEMTVEQVMETVRRDKGYYRRSGGGITLSGGECLLHPEFTAALLSACRAEGIHTCIETALFVEREALDRVRGLVDLYYCDCKLPDEDSHRRLTGRGQGRILDHIRLLTARGERVILRIPMIPAVNDTPEMLSAFAELIPTLGVDTVELLRYNNLGEDKYERCGMAPPTVQAMPQEMSEMEAKRDFLAARLPAVRVLLRAGKKA